MFSDCLFYALVFRCPQGNISNIKGSRKFWPLLYHGFALTGGHTHFNFLIWLQGQVVEKCILIISLGNSFSHVSSILPFVKSSEEGLGIWVANVMSLCNLHVTCDDSQAFSLIPSAVPLYSNRLVRSVSLPRNFHHSCGNFKSGISLESVGSQL